MTAIQKRVEVMLDAARCAGLYEIRKHPVPGITEQEFEEAFEALLLLFDARKPSVRPDVWAYAMRCLAVGIKAIKLQGKQCYVQSPISPTKSSQ